MEISRMSSSGCSGETRSMAWMRICVMSSSVNRSKTKTLGCMCRKRARIILTSYVPTSTQQCAIKFERRIFGGSADELKRKLIIRTRTKHTKDIPV